MGTGASVDDFPGSLAGEIALSRRVLRGEGRLLDTAFFGGGTPTMLDPGQLGGVLAALDSAFGLRAGAEVTTEANPESVSRDSLLRLADAGFTRVSFGMQSAVGSVLAALDRRHTPGQVERAVAWARQAGLDVSVDLIYGAPGETMGQWRRSVDAALALEPDHVSAYALTVEPGTRMGAQAARGRIRLPDPTSWRTNTRRPTRPSPPPATAGTRYRTGPDPAASAGTTPSTGAAATGGDTVRGRIRTSTAPASGTSSTPWPTRAGSGRGRARRPRARP